MLAVPVAASGGSSGGGGSGGGARQLAAVCRLSWDSDVAAIGADVILAADVVYDLAVIPALVHRLRIELASSPRAVALVASVVRNHDTHAAFLAACTDAGLHVHTREASDGAGVRTGLHRVRFCCCEMLHEQRELALVLLEIALPG
jgi:Lysine methyltransferase